ncbi:Zinc finger matrin type 5 [Zostera marina]|uniref:Zinc finger matrin type 5 n=1 Tax=Zostera marina TaxID=29655 RepID=A0A0K9PRE8_ZOSMR|nr:Zinc finger matrin type 5 [Zostera marina]
MPLGKYYCDYCDKQFQDTPSVRKRHLQGVQHKRAKSIYYDTCFVQPLPSQSIHHGNIPQMVGLQIQYPTNSRQNPNLGRSDLVKNEAGMSWGNLPPSLRPPPEGGYPPFPIVDWG